MMVRQLQDDYRQEHKNIYSITSLQKHFAHLVYFYYSFLKSLLEYIHYIMNMSMKHTVVCSISVEFGHIFKC